MVDSDDGDDVRRGSQPAAASATAERPVSSWLLGVLIGGGVLGLLMACITLVAVWQYVRPALWQPQAHTDPDQLRLVLARLEPARQALDAVTTPPGMTATGPADVSGCWADDSGDVHEPNASRMWELSSYVDPTDPTAVPVAAPTR